MITELHIRDLGVIDDVTLELAPGLNILTGETGAGKTMVVSALELLRGARADTDRVRSGAGTAVVEGCVHPVPDEAREWIDDPDDELVVAREVGGQRSRARLGGRLAPVSTLAAALGRAVEIHGQSDTSRLSTPSAQRALLDHFGGAAVREALEAYGQLYGHWRAAADELEALHRDERDRAREADRLRFELAEIEAVAPEPGEDAALDAELARLEHAETLVSAAGAAAAAIAADGGARDALGSAVGALRATAGVDELLDKLGARAEGLAAETQELAVELRAYAEAVELDPQRLEEARDRRGALAGLRRKYGPDLTAVVAYAEGARARLETLDGAEERRGALARQVEELAGQVQVAAEALTGARSAAGRVLADRVAEHLAELALPGAVFSVALDAAELTPHGADRVAFHLSAGPDQPLLPLGRAASGGERSRVALALRLALADADDTPVLVFDEVDAGIGGRVARVVGHKLAQLARGRQVLCVTHLAQLAAFADAHFVVSKDTRAGRTTAAVARLDEAGRVRELARMLSGDPASAAATATATELRAVAQGR